MTNSIMFVYAYGIVMKQGTTHAWSKVNELSRESECLRKWFESPYVQTANQDTVLLKELDAVGL